MRVKCIESFRGRVRGTNVFHSGPHPVKDGIYTVTGDDGWGFRLAEFYSYAYYNKKKFAPLTTDDFTFEDIDEIIRPLEAVPVGPREGA